MVGLRWLRAPAVAIAVVLAGCGAEADTDSAATTAAAEATTTSASQPSSTTAAPASTTTTTEAPPPTDLELVNAGPYEVGVNTFTFTDTARDRELTADVWFPLADGVNGTPHEYTFIPTLFYRSPDAISASPDSISTDGPFPLVIYSHGSGGIRYISSNLTEFIASHGFVVAAVDHTGNTALDVVVGSTTETEVTALNRPADVSALIDEMLEPTADGLAPVSDSIDGDSIAVTGHSFGGYTAYASVSGFDGENGEVAEDDRVDAILTLAPLTVPQLLSDDRLAGIDVPSMIIVGTDDKTTPIDPNVTRPWELGTFEPAYRVELSAAEHQSFTDVCAYQTAIDSIEGIPEQFVEFVDGYAQAGCQPDDMPIGRAQELTNTFAVRFLDEALRGAAPIDPSAVVIPGDVLYLVR